MALTGHPAPVVFESTGILRMRYCIINNKMAKPVEQ
jgi:hypothetical protein